MLIKEIEISIFDGNSFSVVVWVWDLANELVASRHYWNITKSTVERLSKLVFRSKYSSGFELDGVGFSTEGDLAQFSVKRSVA